ncbi:Flp pilus assembly protein CpaB [Dongia deserti]|uniref:Flp pilus assembly protein CpaB n=1 Tax=Dongia deserti TaxID=2268030 RepID=UPI000E65DEF2|nr:Flp pilus assembly protein CpaB [Dongia deserti]
MKVRPLIVLALALFLALAAVFLARNWIQNQATRPTAEVEKASVVRLVVAGTALKFGDRLAKENLRFIDWPAGSVPEGTFKSIDELLEPQPRVVLQAVQPNELILVSKVTGPGQRASLSAVITSGMRAMTIRVNDVLGVAGFVLPGDRVDIMLTREIVQQQPITDVLLQNVKVLGIDQRADQQNNKPDVVKAVTIEVTTEQAQKITLASRVGTLSLALRDVSNVDLARVRPVTLKDLGITEAIGTVEPNPNEKKPETPVVKMVPKPKGNNLPSIGITRGTARQEYKVTPEGTVLQPNAPYEAPAKKQAEEVPVAPPPVQVPPSVPTAAATSS